MSVLPQHRRQGGGNGNQVAGLRLAELGHGSGDGGADRLDRIERGDNAAEIRNDPRLDKVRRAVQVLLDDGDDRAEQVQTIFSLGYDANWEKPKPRY